MSKKKSLPSKKDESEYISKDRLKVLPSLDLKNPSTRTLPAADKKIVLPSVKIDTVEPQRETIDDRIHDSTISGGLKELPANFNERNGDYQVILSDNYFKVLYLDHKQYKKITIKIIENNYQILKKFCDEKHSLYTSGAGAIPIQLEQKYGLKFLNDATAILKKAYDALRQPSGIENYYALLEKKRFEYGKSKIQPLLDTVATIKILDPSTENLIRTRGMEAGLTEKEIEIILIEFVYERKILKGEYSSRFEETEKIYLYHIKKKLKDNILTIEEENELKEDLEAYKISPERFNDLLNQALREIKDCERESTVNRDKETFVIFYRDLLNNYGLDDNGNLYSDAVQKLFERDSSPTEFFPLKKDTRENLIKEIEEAYKKTLKEQKIYFIEEALKNLQVYSSFVKNEKLLKENTSFGLLLSTHKEELIRKAKSIIEYVNELYFTKIGESLYKSKCWIVDIEDVRKFVKDPDKLSVKKFFQPNYYVRINENLLTQDIITDKKNEPTVKDGLLVMDESSKSKSATTEQIVLINSDLEWLADDTRITLSGEIANWAKEQYDFEKKYFESTVEDLLKKYKFGLPSSKQLEVEKNNEFNLSEDERRSIIISKEKPLRIKAERLFTELVESKLGKETIIPSLINNLLDENEKLYLLTEDKNRISYKVKTSKEIIDSKSKPFDVVFNSFIEKIKDKREIDPSVTKKFNLSLSACISSEDIIREIKEFHSENPEHTNFLISEFRKISYKKGLYVIEKSEDSEIKFSEIFLKAIDISSRSYTIKFSQWANKEFVNDMIKIGAAYGIPSDKIQKDVSKYEQKYFLLSTPRWNQFLKLTSIFVIILFTFRLLISSSLPEWVFVENSNSTQKTLLFLDYLCCIIPLPPSFSWAIFSFIFITPFAFNKAIKNLYRSFLQTKIKLFLLFGFFILLISFVSIKVGSSDDFKQYYLEKYQQNVSDYLSNNDFNMAYNEYGRIFNLVSIDEQHKYYYERGLIYYNLKNSSQFTENYADLAISDLGTAIKMNSTVDEYYLKRADLLLYKAKRNNAIGYYQQAESDFKNALNLNHSYFELNKSIQSIHKEINALEKKQAAEKKREEYRRSGFYPDYKIVGSNVHLKEQHSSYSKTVKVLKGSLEVKKTDSWVINDPDIREVIDDVAPTKESISVSIPAGSLVKIIGKVDDFYLVTYTVKQSEISGRIPVISTRSINGIEWIKIKTFDGDVGWILKNNSILL